MADTTILNYDPISTPGANDYLVIARVGANKKIKVSDLFATSLMVSSFNTRTGAVLLTAADLNGLDGSGLTGISSGTGGISNTGSTSIDADTDANGTGVVSLRTRNLDRVIVANNGKVGFAGQTSPTGWLDVLPATTETVLRASRSTGYFIGFSFLQNEDALVGPFEWFVNSATNPGGLRRDTYCQYGYNPRGVTDDMRLYWAIETRWNPGGTTVQHEHYLDYISPSNGGGAVNMRPFGFVIREDVQSIETDFRTSTFRVWTWPDDPAADHPFIEATYPSLTVHDGNLRINPESYTSVADLNAVLIRGLNAIEINSTGLIQVGDDTAAVGLRLNGNVGITNGGPVSTSRLRIQSSAEAQETLWLQRTFAGGGVQTGAMLNITGNADVSVFKVAPNGNVVVGNAAIATNATAGFPYIPSCAGTPTGTPGAITGLVPMVYDTAANKIWFYNGSWRGVVVS